MKTKFYVVDNDGEVTLVEAQTQAAARNHVARKSIGVRYATQAELVALLASGIVPQKAGAEDEPA
jgi:hypothetical protein